MKEKSDYGRTKYWSRFFSHTYYNFQYEFWTSWKNVCFWNYFFCWFVIYYNVFFFSFLSYFLYLYPLRNIWCTQCFVVYAPYMSNDVKSHNSNNKTNSNEFHSGYRTNKSNPRTFIHTVRSEQLLLLLILERAQQPQPHLLHLLYALIVPMFILEKLENM